MLSRSSQKSIFLVAFLAALLYGCPEPKSRADLPGVNKTPLTSGELCGLYLSSDVNQRSSGVGTLCLQYGSFTALEITERDSAYLCRPGTGPRKWANRLLRALDETRIEIDWALARECIDTSRELRTTGPQRELYGSRKSDWDAVRNGPCKSFYAGALADGQECVDDWDCAEGSSCFTDAPWTPGSQTCMKPGIGGEACHTDWHPCAEGFECGVDDICEPLVANGETCAGDSECASGYCEPDLLLCETVPAQLVLGAACVENTECGEECVSCRPKTNGASDTCELLGGEGDYCRDWNDCAWDLGCTAAVCTAVTEDAECGGSIETLCRPGLACASSVACGAIQDEAACDTQPDCAYDTSSLECIAIHGTCAVPPSSGACLNGYLCDASISECVQATTICALFGEANSPCSDDASTAPRCAGGLTCLGGVCQQVCDLNEDCGKGQYCDITQARPTCEAFKSDACVDSDECPDGTYCAQCYYTEDLTLCEADARCEWTITGSCDTSAVCDTHLDAGTCRGDGDCAWKDRCDFEPTCDTLDQPTCGTVQGCSWNTTGSTPNCAPTCWLSDGDETACLAAAPGCQYDAGSGFCDPDCGSHNADQVACEDLSRACLWTGSCEAQVDCAQWDNMQVECGAAATCSFTESGGACDTILPDQTFTCDAQLEVGSPCSSASQCLSDTCDPDDTDTKLCAYETTGCDTENEAPFLRLTFLFGGVWVLSRSRTRQRRA